MVFHIYREDNHCTNKLTPFGLGIHPNIWWEDISQEIREDHTHNR